MRSGKPRFCVIVDLVINKEYVLLNKGGGETYLGFQSVQSGQRKTKMEMTCERPDSSQEETEIKVEEITIRPSFESLIGIALI